ncbi:hypothetical protein C0J52_07620 [Blattella germanica]|nr:hypothetical protein C0J52_07620 [Blattella germanica]
MNKYFQHNKASAQHIKAPVYIKHVLEYKLGDNSKAAEEFQQVCFFHFCNKATRYRKLARSMRTPPAAPSTTTSPYFCNNYRLAAIDFSSIANDCDASAARFATVLQAATTTSSNNNQTYELTTRPPPPISRKQFCPGL